MKPLISYYGGKQRMAKRIVDLIPKHTVYIEPFFGGGAVFFKKPFPPVTNTTHYREVINDSSQDLINLYRQFQKNPDEIIHRIKTTPYSRAEYQRAKEILKSNCDDPLERARAYYVNIQQSFGSKLFSGWGTGVFSRNSAITYKNKISHVESFIDRLAEVHIECDDALNVIKRWDSPQSFFYLDPPYFNTNMGHYGGYSAEDFGKLIDCLNNIQGSFLLSCYDSKISINTDWEKFEFSAHCSVSGTGKTNANRTRKASKKELGNRTRTEIVYRKINRNVRDELKFLYDGDQLACFV